MLLTPGELVRDLREKGLAKETYAVKKWVWLTKEEYELVQATSRALGMPQTQVLRALLQRAMGIEGKEKGPTSG